MNKEEKLKQHPHAYTLRLLQLVLETLPPGCDNLYKNKYEKIFNRFVDDYKTPYEEIRMIITGIGEETWAERMAYNELYRQYGRSSEESHLLNKLDIGIRNKFEQFIQDGGKINYLLNKIRTENEMKEPPPFETYFNPEEKFVITQALIEAREEARKEINALVTDKKKDEYEKLVEMYEKRKKYISGKLAELRTYAELSDKWRDTIIDRVRVFEEGWSVMEKGVNEKKLDRELDYWNGVLKHFLMA